METLRNVEESKSPGDKSLRRKIRNKEKLIEEMMSLLDTYLCLHGLVCNINFKCTFKNFILFCSSKLFIILNVINHIFCLFLRCLCIIQYKKSQSDSIISITILIMEFFLLILFLSKRGELKYLTHYMAKIHSCVDTRSLLKIKRVILFMLVINDVYNMIIIFSYFSDNKFCQLYKHLGGNFIFVTSYLRSSLILYGTMFLELWGYVTPSIPVYFCCFCYAYKNIILELKESISKEAIVNVDAISEAYKSVLILNATINKAFHTMLLITFMILSGKLLHHTYDIILNIYFITSINVMYRLLNIVFSFARFLMICIPASSVSIAASELRNSIHDLPIKNCDRWKYFRLTMKMNETFVGFKILDSVTIDKSLVIVLLGSLISYGVMIATFNVNTNS